MNLTTNINGIKVNYTLTTSINPAKGTLIFLHGWGGSSQSWMPNISKLNQNFNCMAIDMPGFNISSQPDKIWGVEEYSNFINDFAQNFNLGKFILVGKSFGGRVGILYASQHPETLSCLILVDAAGLEKKSLLSKIRILVAKTGKTLLFFLSPKCLELIRNNFYKATGVRKDSDDYKWKVKKIVTNTNLAKDAKKISTPTLIVWGKNDKVLPIKVGKDLNRKIKGSIFKQISGGHNAHQESPEEFNSLVEEFILTNIK